MFLASPVLLAGLISVVRPIAAGHVERGERDPSKREGGSERGRGERAVRSCARACAHRPIRGPHGVPSWHRGERWDGERQSAGSGERRGRDPRAKDGASRACEAYVPVHPAREELPPSTASPKADEGQPRDRPSSPREPLSERGGRDELVRSDERARCPGRAWCQKKAPERMAADQRTTASIGCESSRERRRERWQGREEEKSEPLLAFETSVLWRATRAASREGERECDEVARNAKEARRAS